jgi:hypothetical protein
MNNSSSNYGQSSLSAQEFLMGSGALAQALLVIVISALLFLLMLTLETMYITWYRASRTKIDVLPYTVNPDDKMKTIVQNPNAPNALNLPLSENERTGAEFTYSFFIYLNSNNIDSNQTTTQGLRHVFHKGYSRFTPLMGPGVFIKTNENTLRVYMNSSKKLDNYVDVPNIPLKKWVHITIVCRKNSVEIYINGNVAKKIRLDGAIYQNYQDLILFSQRSGQIKHSDGSVIEVKGAFSGSFSSLVYYSYAISYSEIQNLMNEGPSKESEEAANGVGVASPYLADSWWIR